jgi:hypothetical protein
MATASAAHGAMDASFTGSAVASMRAFYDGLPRQPRAEWPRMMHGMGYNFELYDALFALVLAHVQLSFDDGEYTPRHQAMQAALVPFCSEFGIELRQDLQRSHRSLYAEFFHVATGAVMPERYPKGDENPWLTASRRAATRMRSRLGPVDGSLDRACYALGYLWAVERLSVDEFTMMRAAWQRAGVQAAYLDAHCAVEEDHDAFATRALLAFASPDEPIVRQAIRDHEDDLAGYYRELATLLRAASA